MKYLHEIIKSEGEDEGVPSIYLDDSPSVYTGTKATQKDEHWGYHLILDCSNCNKDIDNTKKVAEFLSTLVKELKMKAIGKPVIYQPKGAFDQRGISATQIISTSSITFHGDDEEWAAYIDVFSCKVFRPKVVIKTVQKFFQPKHIGALMLFRDASKIWPKKPGQKREPGLKNEPKESS